MRIGIVIGTVTLSRSHPSLEGARLHWVVPQSLSDLTGQTESQAEPLVMYDDLGAGQQSQVAFSEGGEAAQPFQPEQKPIDAYCAAIIDNIVIATPEAERPRTRRGRNR